MVLQAINWELSLPTPHDYFDHLLRRLPLTAEQRVSVRRHAHTFAAMCIAGKDSKLLSHYSDLCINSGVVK